MGNNGPWDTPEGLRKTNALLRYSEGTASNGWHVSAMAYESRWNATDQVPQRLLDPGLLSRYGSLDSSDGGQTRRLSLSGQWINTEPGRQTRLSAYAIDSRFQLWSNFTYNLKRFDASQPTLGDQFAQTDMRRSVGVDASQRINNTVAGLDGQLTVGAQWRGERIAELGLFLTQTRVPDTTVRLDGVAQDLFSLHAQQLLYFSPAWRGYLGLRGDALSYRVDGREAVYGAANSGQGQAALWQPKVGLVWSAHAQHEFYVNSGVGFHSNDVRGATTTLDPQTGAPTQRVPVLVACCGAVARGRPTCAGVT